MIPASFPFVITVSLNQFERHCMILWTGWEVLVVVFIVVGQAAAFVIATQVSGNPDYTDLHGWTLGLGYFAAALMCWLLDARVTRGLDDLAGRGSRATKWPQDRPRAYTFHPIRWCGGAMAVIGVLLCCYHRTPEQLWQSRQARAARLNTPHTNQAPPSTTGR